MEGAEIFDASCASCARLAAHVLQIKHDYPDYHCAPVAPFGDPKARLLIVGLAPGLHGANASGRPFTGDHAGIILYRMLHEYGFASTARAVSRNDGLRLTGCRITNAVKCLPPANKPTTTEVANCSRFLRNELELLPARAVILALGRIAHDAVVRALGLRLNAARFAHGATHALARGQWLLDSYHCSRYNTHTGRLTEAMFEQVFVTARALLERAA